MWQLYQARERFSQKKFHYISYCYITIQHTPKIVHEYLRFLMCEKIYYNPRAYMSLVQNKKQNMWQPAPVSPTSELESKSGLCRNGTRILTSLLTQNDLSRTVIDVSLV
jgi:hypothetical protein